ncbi:papain-like cysteine protease family protein [Sphingomonas kyeonggiensis]|uniref:Peptidase C39-like domain-containing protein n=1 Tax=Sphingomonas kyeonggiensis TaxID=1268553 RepID=A0A7W6NXF9_9SPHN|nr:papain-like cysteine protease family protein [Sphingomonas kyeonggiensis]MBB4099218.1 hypothetical protein [Sphingomonas kyeonggiensis]
MPGERNAVWRAAFPPPGVALPAGAEPAQVIPGFRSNTEQKKSNWCWAAVCASILGVLPRPGVNASQEAVVAFVQGASGLNEDRMEHLGTVLRDLGYQTRVLGGASLDFLKFARDVVEPIGRGHPLAITIVWQDTQLGHAICAFGYGKLGGLDALVVYDPAVDLDADNVTMVTIEGMQKYAAQMAGPARFAAWSTAHIVGEA